MVTIFNVFFSVIPGAAAGTHRYRHEQTSHDGTHQQTAQGCWSQHQTHHNRCDHWQQGRNHHLFDGSRGEHVNSRVVFGLAGTVHDALDFAKLTPDLDDHRARRAAYRLHRHGAKQVRNKPANKESDDDHRVAQVKADNPAVTL